MPGPNLASRDAPRIVLCSPQRLLSVADRRSERRRTLSPAKPAPRNGHSLPHSGCSFTEPPLRVRRSWPASSAPRRTGLEPVRLPAPLPVIRFPDLREAQRLQPVARTICPALPTAPQALLPLGTFQSLRLTARPDSPFGKLASAEHPISVHSPPAEALILPPTDQRSRFAVSRGARCSANLLEPTPSCSQTGLESNGKCAFGRRFPQKKRCSFSIR